ncbi:hydrolase [Apiospora phragmitis]|uniref:Hydrolase n=1 Tax=Apiospora phragmitis TaxID=2905665 RepID=A0ABR1T3Y1_9PEZI
MAGISGEKCAPVDAYAGSAAPRRQPRRRQVADIGTSASWSLKLLLAALCAVWYFELWPLAAAPDKTIVTSDSTSRDSVWSQIKPSEKLEWHPCFSAAQRCARLTVPMDYHRPLNESASHPKVHIAIVLVPGHNRTDEPMSYGESPLLLNPGGPGGSGAMFALGSGQQIQGVVGTDRDIIGFDPRGIGATTPQANCFVADDWNGVAGQNMALMNRLTWEMSGHDVGLVNSSNVALSKLDVRARALAKLCQQVSDESGDGSIFQYSSTPNVARDMLSIVHAWDAWRESADETAKPAQPHPESDEMNSNHDQSLQSTKGKLVYWGFSYGTLLGATFAAMFPDSVGRVMLDGVVDADHYGEHPRLALSRMFSTCLLTPLLVEPVWRDSIVDSDAIFGKFFSYCAEAEENCAFYQKGDTPKNIESRYHDLLAKLLREPKIVTNVGGNIPAILNTGDIRMILFQALYAPNLAYPSVAQLLQAIYTDQGLERWINPLILGGLCKNLSLPIWPDDAQKAVMCSDKRYKLNETVPELEEMFEEMSTISSFVDVWMGVMMGCNDWTIEAKDPPMDWDDHPARKPAPINTSFPVLFLTNHLDPVTPLYAALKMTRKFAGASIVEQADGLGHCTLACTSMCTIRHIRAYLNEGKVPRVPDFGDDSDKNSTPKWETCECQEKPWRRVLPLAGPDGQLHNQNADGDESLLNGLSVEEAQMMHSWSQVRHSFVEHKMNAQFGQYQKLKRTVLGLPEWMTVQHGKCSAHHDAQ